MWAGRVEEHAEGPGAESDVESVVELLQKVEGDAGKVAHEIAELGRDRQSIAKRLSEARGAVSALSYLAEGQQQLSAFDAHFAAGTSPLPLQRTPSILAPPLFPSPPPFFLPSFPPPFFPSFPPPLFGERAGPIVRAPLCWFSTEVEPWVVAV